MRISGRVISWVTVTTFAAVVAAGMLVRSPRVQAQNDEDDHGSRIEQGFAIAPVPLNLERKNRALVALSTYLVNTVAARNDCHDAGPATQYSPGRNPFLGQPKKRANAWPMLR